jgi:hypothetical protein
VDGISDVLPALLLVFVLGLWFGLFIATQRFVFTMVGVDTGLVLCAASISIFLTREVLDGSVSGYLPVLVGVLAVAVAGPKVPVLIGATEYFRGRSRHADDRASVRVPIDPPLTSTVEPVFPVAFAVGTTGRLALAAFVAAHVLGFAVLTSRRLSVDRVEENLAKLRVGSPLQTKDLRRYLRQRGVLWVAVGGAALAGSAVLAYRRGDVTTTGILLQEWAGVLLVGGLYAVSRSLSTSAATPLLIVDEPGAGPLAIVRDRVRSWRRARYSWLVQLVLVALLLSRPVLFVLDWLSIVDAIRAVWNWVTGFNAA